MDCLCVAATVFPSCGDGSSRCDGCTEEIIPSMMHTSTRQEQLKADIFDDYALTRCIICSYYLVCVYRNIEPTHFDEQHTYRVEWVHGPNGYLQWYCTFGTVLSSINTAASLPRI